jgi:hypothetical protein
MTYAQTALPLSTGRQTRQTEKNAAKASPHRFPGDLGLSTLSTCRQGVEPLSAKRQNKPKGVHLQLLGNGSPDRFIGVRAVPNRLPELLRYPGETAQAFCARALHYVQGAGPLVAYLMYPPPPHQVL